MGRAGSGKTTVADMLDRNYDNRYRPFALAGPLKRMCSELIGRPLTKADRALMIEFGQSMRAMFGSGVWCDMTMRAIEAWWKSDDDNDGVRYPVIVEDGRHAYEYEYFVVQRGFVPVRIVAPDEVRFERLLKRDGVDQRDVLAGQETELDGVDVAFTIDNGGTMDELERQVSEMLARINEEGTK